MKNANKFLEVLQRNPFGAIETLYFLLYNINHTINLIPNAGTMTYKEYLTYNLYQTLTKEDFYTVRDTLKEATNIFYNKYYVEK